MTKHKSSSARYWLYGTHAVAAALSNARRRVCRLLVTADTPRELDPKRHPKPEMQDNKALERLLGPGAVHQGIAAEVEKLEPLALEDILAGPKKLLLVLDQVTDPHNVGAMLRSAAAFGVAAVITPKDHAPEETAVMAKAASGGLEMVPMVQVTNLAHALDQIKKAGWWVAGLDGAATQALHQSKLGIDTALVMGAEGKGLRRLTAERCDMLVKLPMHPQMESLNVSNAAAVALYALCSTSGFNF